MDPKAQSKVLIFTRRLAIFLILIQSIGIRFFGGQGFALGLIELALITGPALKNFRKSDIRNLFWIFGILGLSKLVNTAFQAGSFFYQSVLILNAYFLLSSYNAGEREEVAKDIFVVLKWLVYYAAVCYLLYFLVPQAFENFGLMNKSLLNVFYVSQSSYRDFIRNTAIFWEPGVAQLAFNLFLFLAIYFKKGWIYYAIGFVVVLSTFSTTGFILLIVNFGYLLFNNVKLKALILPVFAGGLLFIFLFPLLKQNILDKTEDTNTSGLTRERDFLIGFKLISERPIVGHGLFGEDYLAGKSYVKDIESDLFSTEYIQISGEVAGGYTNGLLGFFAWYGLPVGLFVYSLFLKNKIISGTRFTKTIFCLIVLGSCLSEPITYTSLFLIFPFSKLRFEDI